MKDILRKIGIVLLGIGLNFVGRYVAYRFNLPIWFDMTGTVVTTYFIGAGGGIIAGIGCNLLASFYDFSVLSYTPISIVAAFLVQYFIKKNY